MGRPKSKTDEARTRQARSRSRRLVIAGILSGVVLAGLAAWIFYPTPSPLSAAESHRGGARLAVDREEIDFGSVRFEKLVQARFRLKNVGDQPLRIATDPRVEVVEGCWPSEVVVGSTTLAPGKETEVWTQFTMHRGMGGPHLFVIRLATNDGVAPERLLKIRSVWTE